MAPHLLGRHVAHGAEHRTSVGHGRHGVTRLVRVRRGHRPREAEVEDLQAPVFEQEDVLRLQVAMDQPLSCAAARPRAICAGPVEGLADRDRSRLKRSRSVSPSSSSVTA